MHSPSIGIVIPTFQAAKHLPFCLPPLINSPLKPRILIIDSSSTDETISLAKKMGAETLVIPQSEFNHGLTREKGRLHLDTDIIVMITQDAYATSSDTLEKLITPIVQQKASVAYARQVPHIGAGFLEAFPRFFNYPAISHIRGLKDISQYGVYTFFCSNSCAAYRNQALSEIGGFPSTLFGEDTIVVAKLLQHGHQIAYVASAEVRHSHHYSLKQEFARHFDIGLMRSMYQPWLSIAGKDTQRGKAYARALLQELGKNNPSLIPYALAQLVSKFLGYRIGQASLNAPLWLKKLLSSQKLYWQYNRSKALV